MIAYADGVLTLLALLPVYALACARVTGLIVKDELFGTPRRKLLNHLVAKRGDNSLLAYVFTCPWCMSVWVGAPIAAAWWWAGTSPWTLLPAAALAFSQFTGMTAMIGRG